MTSAPVSIVMPVYNGRADYLDEALASVFAQTCGDWELVLADDASRPDVIERLRGWRARDPERVTLLERSKNVGLFANLNDAIRRARHAWILILCTDDRLLPDALATCHQNRQRLASSDLVVSEFLAIDEHGTRRPSIHGTYLRSIVRSDAVLDRALAIRSLLRVGSINGNITGLFFDRALLGRGASFREDWTHAADYLWLYDSARVGQLAISYRPIAEVRSHAGTLSGANHRNGRAVTELGEVLRRLMADPANQHGRARLWAADLLRHSLWLAVKEGVLGDRTLASTILASVRGTTGLPLPAWRLAIDLPRRAVARSARALGVVIPPRLERA